MSEELCSMVSHSGSLKPRRKKIQPALNVDHFLTKGRHSEAFGAQAELWKEMGLL